MGKADPLSRENGSAFFVEPIEEITIPYTKNGRPEFVVVKDVDADAVDCIIESLEAGAR